MSHNYLIIKTEWVPEWTKQNVPTYNSARFNNDQSEMIIDNAHPISTFLKWLGPIENADAHLQFMLQNSVAVSLEEFKVMESNPGGIWFSGGGE